MPELLLPQGRLHYLESEDPTAQPPVVFIHGAGSSGGVWLYQLRALRHGPLGIALDLPGHGLSDDMAASASGALLDLYADALFALLDGLQITRCVVVGHALGAAVALYAAAKRPGVFSSLCLVSASLSMPAHHLVSQALRGTLPSWSRMMQDLLYSPSTPRRFVEKAVESGFQAPPHIIQRDFDLWMLTDLHSVPTADLPQVLFICGADDAMVPVPLTEALSLHLGSSRVEVIEEAGHMVMIERHKRFNALLQTLLCYIKSESK